MKKFASVLLAGTMMSGAAAFGSFAYAQGAPFVLAQAEVPPPPPGAGGEAPPEEKQPRKQREERQGGQMERPAGGGQGSPERRQEQQQRQQRQEERQQQRQAPAERPPVERPAPVEKQPPIERPAPPAARELPPVEKAPPATRELPPVQKQPPVERQAPPLVEKQAPPVPRQAPVEKQAPAADPVAPLPPAGAPDAPPADRKQKQIERQLEQNNGPTPPIPPVAPRSPPPAAPDVAPPPAPPVPGADAPPPPAPPVPPVPGSVPPPVDGKQPPPPRGEKQLPPPAAETAPSAPSVAPAPPPAGEKPAIPPDELKGGQRTPEQRERAEQRADQEFKQRDRKNDERFGRRVEEQGDRTIIREGNDRVIIRDGDRTIIRSDENERLGRNARDVREERRGNQTVTVIQRPDGSEIVTIKDQDGNLIRRVRRFQGREVVIIDNQGAWERGGRWDRDRGWRDRDRDRGLHLDFYLDIPAVRIGIPQDEYIVDADDATYEDFEEAFDAPPLVRSERPYSLQEVTQNVRLRERVRSIDLNSLNFPTGEWTVPPDQIGKLDDLARALKAVIGRDPSQVYLVEGHTDAVGSQIDNLSLSDRRAEEVAAILTEHYQIPAENLVTQGYGEDYLKVNTLSANAENRRVTIRNITQLLGTQQSQAAPQ
jgi:outer membrane protein OmpA-like peptidoglycan-associated protein